MKAILSTILLCFIYTVVVAQRPIQVIPSFTNPLPTETGDLIEQYQNYTVTIINYTENPQEIYLLADLFGDNGVAITMDRFYQPIEPFNLPGDGVVYLTSQEIEELNSDLTEDQIFFEGVTQQQLIFGSIPEGNYTLCLNAFDFETGEILSTGCTQSFYVGNANIPRIITPFEEEVIPDSDLPVFNISWEFPGNNPAQAMDIDYILKLVDITENYDWDLEELFADNGIPVVLETSVEGMTNYLYNGLGDDPPLIYGHEYGIRIQAGDPNDNSYFGNGGYTEIRRFWYGDEGGTIVDSTGNDNIVQNDTLPSDCEGRCNPTLTSNTTPVTDINAISSIRIGHFYLENYNLTLAGDKFNGDAEIVFNFISDIRVKVDVANLKVNAEGIAFEGEVRSQLAQEESLEGIADYLRLPDGLDPALNLIPDAEAELISDLLEGVRTVDALVGNNAVGLPLGIPFPMQGNEFYLGLTDINIKPDGAKARVMLSAKMAMFEGERPLLLVGDSVCIHPQGFGGEYTFGLMNDLDINNAGEDAFELFLSGENGPSDNYCSVEMGCDGVETLNLYGHMLFPRSILTPVVENMDALPPDQKVRADFGFTLNTEGSDSTQESSHLNWIAQVSMGKFEITKLKGWQFEITDAYLDMSDIANAPNAQFPEDYHTTTPDFRGFYMKQASLSPPAHLITDSTSVMVNDLLIDPRVYGIIQAENILPIENGNLAGYGFGIDSIFLHFYDSQLLSGRMKGPLQIPITDITDSLYYFALIEDINLPEEEAAYAYVFDVSFQDNVSIPLMVAEAEIYDDSYLDIVFIPSIDSNPYVQTVLHGVLNIDTESFYPSNLPELPAHAKMFGIEYQFDYTSGVGFDSENSFIGFASPQKGLGGFPINIDNFDVGLNAEFNTIAVQFNVDISFAKGELDLGAGVQFSLVSNLQTLDVLGNIVEDGGQGALNTIKTFKLERIQFDSIIIEVDKGSFGFYGMIAFFNDPLPDGGRNKGVMGEVRVTLPVVTVELTAIFGNIGTPPDLPEGAPMVYNEDFFTYWYVKGLVILSSGIPICSGVGLYGLGGGVGYNMIQTESSQIEDGQIVGDPVFEPVWNSFRLEFTVIFGTHPKPDAFNADVTFIAQFVNGGLDMIGIEGDGYIMTPITERADPKVYVGVGIYLYAQNEVRDWYIDGYLRVAINVNDKFVGNMDNPVVPNQMVDATFYVAEDSWYFYAGQPDMDPYDDTDPRGSAEFRINDNLTAEFKAYLMVGHGIPTVLPPLPPDIQRILDSPSGELDGTESASNIESGIDENAAELGAGFAHGSSGSLRADIDARIIYASLFVTLGYDMNLTQRSTVCANTGSKIGINGWYAEGQAYAGVEGNLGVQVKIFGKEHRFSVMELAAAIALFGGAPAPAYFGGRASVRYNLLGGKLKGSGSFQFSVGERCAPVPNDPLGGINFFEGVEPAHDERDVPPYARALCKFTLPMDETIIIPAPVEDANGEIIDIEELGYTPKVSYTLKRDFINNKTSVPANFRWLDDNEHDAFVVRSTEMFQPNRWYKLNITVKAIDEQTGGWLRVDDEIWKQDTTIRFKTGPMPDELYDLVQYSVPMPYERYFLQNESGQEKIYFTHALDRNFYFPTSNGQNFGPSYQYYIRLTNLNTTEELEVPFTNNCTGFGPHLAFNLPQLDNESVYAMQVIRKSNLIQMNTTISNSGKVEIINEDDDQMTLDTRVIPPGELLEPGEFLLYHTYFRTSKYDNMSQKIASADVQNKTYFGNSNIGGKKLRVNFDLDEKFERTDFRSFTPQSEMASDMVFNPRVKMTDIFNKPYHNNAESKIYGLMEYYTNNMYGGNFFLPLPALNVDWDNYSNYTLNPNQMTGSFDDPLSETEVAGLWGDYLANGTFTYTNPTSSVTFSGFNGEEYNTSIYLSPSYNLTYDTHLKVSFDKKNLKDWANNYITFFYNMISYATLIVNDHPQFITKKNQLASSNFKITSNHGTYGVHFNRNRSHVPGGEYWSWFLNDIEFTTPYQSVTANPSFSGATFGSTSTVSATSTSNSFSSSTSSPTFGAFSGGQTLNLGNSTTPTFYLGN